MGVLVAVLEGGLSRKEVGREAEQRANCVLVDVKLGTAEGVDDVAGEDWGVHHLQLEVDVEGHVASTPAPSPPRRPVPTC